MWKVINQLKNDGHQIEAVRNRGYKLLSSPDLLSEQEIKSILRTKWFGNKVLFFDSIDSTNSVIKREAEKQVLHGLLAVAEKQTAGKGRRGRAWESPAGSGIWMSFMLTPDIGPEKASMLTIVAAMAVAEAISEKTGLETKIKWPNDIVIGSHKAVGILTEMSAELSHVNYVVIGIGVNVNTESFPDEIKDVATSLKLEKKRAGMQDTKINRAEIIEAVGRHFEKYYALYIEKQDLSLLRDAYNQKLANAGNKVKAITSEGEKIYTAVGIDDEGLLIVENDDGRRERIRSGEVSVRGLYGYV